MPKAVWVSPVKGKKNKVLLDPHGFRMHFKKNNTHTKRYHCGTKESKGCPVIVTLHVESDTITSCTGVHNHDKGLVEQKVRKVVSEKIEQAVLNPSLSPRNVLQEISNTVLRTSKSQGLSYIPNIKNLAQNISRKRKAEMDCPSIPKSWEDMIIPEEYKKSTDGKLFNILEERILGKDERIKGFASESGLEVMRAASDWFIDGTFEIMFTQLYVVVCKVIKVNIPCAFFCLTNKEYTSYKRIFECLVNKGAGSTDRIHIDFEPGALRAVRECLPSSEIIGCDFHFKKCIREKIQKLGLIKAVNEYEEFQTSHRYLWALSHVPIDRVQQVLDDFIVSNVPKVDEEEHQVASSSASIQ